MNKLILFGLILLKDAKEQNNKFGCLIGKIKNEALNTN